jgi:hypothetical protein
MIFIVSTRYQIAFRQQLFHIFFDFRLFGVRYGVSRDEKHVETGSKRALESTKTLSYQTAGPIALDAVPDFLARQESMSFISEVVFNEKHH